MKNFFKSILIVLVLGVVISAIASGSKSVTSTNTALTSVINGFEGDIESGRVIKDGVMENVSVDVEGTGESANAIASLINALGGLLIAGISAFLKLVSSLITKFIG